MRKKISIWQGVGGSKYLGVLPLTAWQVSNACVLFKNEQFCKEVLHPNENEKE